MILKRIIQVLIYIKYYNVNNVTQNEKNNDVDIQSQIKKRTQIIDAYFNINQV